MPRWDPTILDHILAGGSQEAIRTQCEDEATARELRFALYNRRRKVKLGLNSIITLHGTAVLISPLKAPQLVIGGDG